MNCLIKRKILCHHAPLYLNVYDQAHQKRPIFHQKRKKLEISGNPEEVGNPGKTILLGGWTATSSVSIYALIRPFTSNFVVRLTKKVQFSLKIAQKLNFLVVLARLATLEINLLGGWISSLSVSF